MKKSSFSDFFQDYVIKHSENLRALIQLCCMRWTVFVIPGRLYAIWYAMGPGALKLLGLWIALIIFTSSSMITERGEKQKFLTASSFGSELSFINRSRILIAGVPACDEGFILSKILHAFLLASLPKSLMSFLSRVYVNCFSFSE